MYESHLRSLFAKLLASAACVPAVLLGACEGPAMTSPDMSEPLAQPLPIRTVAATAGGPLCSPTTTLASPNLRLVNPAAYLEAGRFGAPCLLDGQGCAEGSITALERRPYVRGGTECADAPDVPACQALLTDALRAACADPVYCQFRYVATTSGGTVQVLTDVGGASAALAPIDSVAESQLVAWMAGFDGFDETPGSCPSPTNWDTRPTAAGYDMTVLQTNGPGCIPPSQQRCEISVSTAGAVNAKTCTVLQPCRVLGRRPEGLQELGDGACDSLLGSYLAGAAELEAAAVTAFVILERELRAHGAPEPLLALARQAAADEVRHSAVTAELARKYGGTPQPPVVVARPVRSLPEIAAENEVEGCVRETYAALLATYQAAHARDPQIAAALQGIAEDETRHAALSLRVAAWAKAQLSPAAKDELRSLRQRAITTLRTELAAPPPPALSEPLGLPSPLEAQALLHGLEHGLWAQLA